MSENGCKLYIEKICAEEKRSKAFVEGLGKFNDLIAQHFHGVKTQENILMKGRSRTECSYIKNLFDQFIEGPAIENREIEELGAKYEEFYKAMGGLNDDVAAKRKVEDSVMGVAIEAEMQGFIYKSQKSPGKQALPEHLSYALVQIWYAIPIKCPE